MKGIHYNHCPAQRWRVDGLGIYSNKQCVTLLLSLVKHLPF